MDGLAERQGRKTTWKRKQRVSVSRWGSLVRLITMHYPYKQVTSVVSPFSSPDMVRGGPPIDRSNSLGWPSSDADFNSLMQRRSSSIGLSMIDSDLERRRSLGSLGPVVGLDGDPGMPPHRPLVGGGAAAAYEAARADHYAQKNAEQQRRASSLGLGMAGGNLGGGMPQMGGFSVNPNQ